ncbi:amino acid racemase (plasmid) [Roseibium aggregatum]|uniref:aspartate/glutamate racemase family protein n=1 Tax=Roseibium aggregatum TaxID=187304 RepID=UPI001E465075|nr:amino acid racemase [Roseibium aggregatum]UES60170.1 amino acid racemase [Roseibium aggregatum]UES60281.1 amino acid racemase [Roseibium aggregatum]
MIGVLGGMGPLATVDLFEKIIRATAAERDQENLPLIIYSNPHIPDRQAAYFSRSPESSPVPAMLTGIRSLEAAGAHCIVVACNTAHHWFDVLQAETELPLFHIADAVCFEIETTSPLPQTVGLLGTLATVESGFYQERLSSLRLNCVTLSRAETVTTFDEAVTFVKKGELTEAFPFAIAAIETLVSKGADLVILACTELPVALANQRTSVKLVDATNALAKSVVKWQKKRMPNWSK